MSLLKDKIEIGIEEVELEAQTTLGRFPPFFRWVFIFLILAIIPAYYIAKDVSCRIWLSRYGQGAITAKPSFTNPQAPQISPVSVTTLGSGQYAAIAQISNPNLDLSLDKVPYEFDFYNAQKQQIYSYDGAFFLLPNQTKYLTVPTFSLPAQITYANAALPQTLPWQKRLRIPQVALNTSLPSTSTQFSPEAFVVQGNFVNNSPYSLGQVRLTFVLFDTGGKIIGVSQRDEFTVAPFETRAYKQLWPNMTVNNLGQVQVTADTDTLDPNNISIPTVAPGPASDLSHPGTNP